MGPVPPRRANQVRFLLSLPVLCCGLALLPSAAGAQDPAPGSAPAQAPTGAQAPEPVQAGTQEPARVPRLVAETREIDLGQVVRGATAEARFELRNEGDDVLRILRAKPG